MRTLGSMTSWKHMVGITEIMQLRRPCWSVRDYTKSASLKREELVDAGQPTYNTHPELVAPTEIMPGISSEEFALRRQKLAEAVPPGSLVILGAATIKQMTEAVPYPYRQDADFLYFTGCQQPGGIAVIDDRSGFCMFMPQPDPEREIWDGRIAGPDTAVDIFGADRAYSTRQIPEILPEMIRGSSKIIYDTSSPKPLFWGLPDIQEALKNYRVQTIQKYSHKLRWIKSPSEILRMKEVADITCQGFLKTMSVSKHFAHERILAATVEHECRIRGAQRMSFPTVSAGGASASVIHYSRNDKHIQEESMVLLDAGCELHGYVSDMTRTWPVSGSFSDTNREVYEIVLETMKECFKLCKPGATLREIHMQSGLVLSRGLLKLGLISDISSIGRSYRTFNPSAVGHYLGMDVHDCAAVSVDIPLQPGVVITIEPALYIPVNSTIPERLRGIGVRIEDEVLITSTGHEILTESAPKEVDEVESWLAQCLHLTEPSAQINLHTPEPHQELAYTTEKKDFWKGIDVECDTALVLSQNNGVAPVLVLNRGEHIFYYSILLEDLWCSLQAVDLVHGLSTARMHTRDLRYGLLKLPFISFSGISKYQP
ncbi:hypothetical protein R1flu_018548 [Riccia fluitans]|uniref:Aminopeptidase P N-terminal domain-containing protein n=1 Tax=Riccia fluitans TaxID=41844 RepID=A0ABD1ZHH9_9MARC